MNEFSISLRSGFWINKLMEQKQVQIFALLTVYLFSMLHSSLLSSFQMPLRFEFPSSDDGHVFCYEGVSPMSVEGLMKLWIDVWITVDSTPKDGLLITMGNSPMSALSAGKNVKSQLWKVLQWKGSHIFHFSSYGVNCIALTSSHMLKFKGQTITYTFSAVMAPMYFHILLFLAGVVLLMRAPQLSRLSNSLTITTSSHYATSCKS